MHKVFESMGLTPIQVITMLYKYIERERKISFSLSIPNEKTAKAIREAKAGKGLIKSGSLDELFDKWEIE